MPLRIPRHKTPRPAKRDRRPSASARGYDVAWRAFAHAYLQAHPLCVKCEAEGKLVPATCIDHVRALSKGGEQYDPANLEALCATCHGRKSVACDGAFGRRKT